MGIWNWLLHDESEKRAAIDGGWVGDSTASPPIPSRAEAISSVGTGEALSLANVFRAVQIIATSTTQLSLDAYRGDEKLEPTPLFIRQPNVDTPYEVFLEETTNSLSLTGNAYWRIYRDAQGRIQNLEVLNPLDVQPVTTAAGRVTGYQYRNPEKPLPANEVKHLQFLRVPGNAKGLGPIQAAQKELRGAIDLRDFANNWFHDSGVPSGILKTEQSLTAETAEQARQQWDSVTAGRTRVLGNGLGYQSIYLSPRDAQFLDNQNFTVRQVSRLFGIPAGLMLTNVEGSSQTYSNISQQWVEFSKFTLSRYTREIEVAFSDLLPRGTKARFNFEAFLRPDVVTRYQMHQQAITSGWMTPNEVRAIENLPPITGGNELKKPSAVPVKQEARDA